MKFPGGFQGSALTLARMITPPDGSQFWAFVVTEHCFFSDESCTHSTAVATVVAGYLAPLRLWEPYKAPCLRAHREARLEKPFHMSHFVTPGHEEYAHLTPSERNTLIDRLVGAICNTPKTGFIAAVSNADYEAVFPHEFKKRMRHPQFFCFQLITKIVASWAPNNLPAGDAIYFAFEKQDGTQDRVRGCYSEIASPRHDPGGYLFPKCAIVEKVRAPELVAADILANCAGRFIKRPGLTMRRADDPTLYRLLTNSQLKHRWKYYNREMLEELASDMAERGVMPIKKRAS